MKNKQIITTVLSFIFLQISPVFGQENKATTGPVFKDVGEVYTIDNLGLPIDTALHYKAIFDIDKKQTNPAKPNNIILSLHRYYNMHTRYGVNKDNIHLVIILHGHSTKDALLSAKYKEKYGVDNPNVQLLKSLSAAGVKIYLCGQSMSWSGYSSKDILPEVKIALSAMTVLTVYQMQNYALIKF